MRPADAGAGAAPGTVVAGLKRMPGEFSLVDAIARRAAVREDVVLGIGDDAAILAVPAGHQLVVAMDTLNAGVHLSLIHI